MIHIEVTFGTKFTSSSKSRIMHKSCRTLTKNWYSQKIPTLMRTNYWHRWICLAFPKQSWKVSFLEAEKSKVVEGLGLSLCMWPLQAQWAGPSEVRPEVNLKEVWCKVDALNKKAKFLCFKVKTQGPPAGWSFGTTHPEENAERQGTVVFWRQMALHEANHTQTTQTGEWKSL